MKRIAMVNLLMTSMVCSALGQIDVSKLITGNQGSPEAIAAIHYGREGKLIWIFYHAPSVRGRHVFNGPGALQPDGTIWRLGADDATVLRTDADLDIGGLAVPKGEYTLYVDLDSGNWKLIVNKQLTDARGRPQWGINMDRSTTNNPSTELGAPRWRWANRHPWWKRSRSRLRTASPRLQAPLMASWRSRGRMWWRRCRLQ